MTASKNRKTRILQIIYNLEYGGSERLASFLAYAVDRTRFEARVLGLYGGGPITEELKRHHIPYDYFPHESGFGRRCVLQRKLCRFIRMKEIDIVQVHGAYPFTRILPAAKLTRTKVICTLHSKHSIETVARLRTMFRLGTLFCDRIVVVSNDLKSYVEHALGIKRRRLRVIHNGVDLTKFDAAITKAHLTDIPDGTASLIRVGVVGRLREAKDHRGLFNAWAKVVPTCPGMRLFLVGDGELRNELEQRTRDLDIADTVSFLGERDDLPQVLSHMDVIVLPSKRESFPISILEAMAMKKPVIATSVGGIPEIIKHGFNGYLVPAQRPDALAEAIVTFATNRQAFEQMALEGYKNVRENFSDRIVVAKYQRLYDEAYHA
ncbi:MAG: glycosyltransferase [Deltaproteobacteria bacterium]|nr:glycosyltransferase [Deltaproteobacteria bacterium]